MAFINNTSVLLLLQVHFGPLDGIAANRVGFLLFLFMNAGLF